MNFSDIYIYFNLVRCKNSKYPPVVYICGLWGSYFPQFSLIFPHFFLNLKIRTTFLNLLKILKTTQIYHTTPSSSHDISTNSYKSSQLNSISLKSSVLYPTSKTYSSSICSIKATNYLSKIFLPHFNFL